jgi:hypothetical protein
MSFSTWLRNLTSSHDPRGPGQHRPAAPRFQPQLDALEDRCLPSFGNPITTAVYQPTALMVTADVNGDGKPDLITLSNSADVEVWLGKGNGHFSYYRQLIIGGTNTPTALAVADVNGDGKLDIITANDPGDGAFFGATPSISVFLGNGNGTFQSARTSFVLPSDSYSLAVGDFNGDGRIDIVAAGYNSVTVVPNYNIYGGGYFTSAQTYTFAPYTALAPSSVAVGDFNGDGKPDIAATAYYDGTVNVLLNKGDGSGTFLAAQPYAAGGIAAALAVGDFNGDGKLDLVVANDSNNTVSVLMNNGDGTFGAAQSYAVGGAAMSVAVGDFNHDGKLDIVVAGAEMDVLLNNGTGTFATAQKVGPAGGDVVVGDFNGDGWLDLAQLDYSVGIEVLLNKADWNKHK